MERARLVEGRFQRIWDDYPLKTKIVATIGGPGSHENGIRRVGDLEEESAELSYEYLIRNLAQNGATVIRLNTAYMDEQSTKTFFESLRKVAHQLEDGTRKPLRLAVLTDLPGPRIRLIGLPEEGRAMKIGGSFIVHFRKPGEVPNGAVCVCLNEIPLAECEEKALVEVMNQVEKKIGSGDEVRAIVGDGDVIMVVEKPDREKGTLQCKVIKEGKIRNTRFTLKDIRLDIPSFTEQDRRILDWLFSSGAFQDDGLWAFVGLSFAQTVKDILEARRCIETKIRQHLSISEEAASFISPAVIAKIETAQGYDQREHILDVAGGMMVARGDLGIQTDIERIATMEKELIRACRKRGKPVITATQMLYSMVDSIEPTRAEVTDVFNAILDGTDAVMLSDETSRGRYPFHAVRKMAFVAAEAEHFLEKVDKGETVRRKTACDRFQGFLADAEETLREARERLNRIFIKYKEAIARCSEPNDRELRSRLEWEERVYGRQHKKLLKQRTTDSISQSACMNSENEGITAILALTTTGRTARMISRFRPTARIIGAAHDTYNARKLLLSYGVVPMNFGEVDDDARPGVMFETAGKAATQQGLLGPDEGVVLTSGNRPRQPGTTNTIQIQERLRTVLPPDPPQKAGGSD